MKRVIVFGGSGHVGSTAVQALRADHEVIIVGRHSEPAVDVQDESSIRRLFEAVEWCDAIIVASGEVPFRPAPELSAADLVSAFRGKVLSQLNIVRIGLTHLRDGGSITLTSGVLARAAIASGAAAAMANGAIESYVLAAAPEMPRAVRINAVSPTVLANSPEYFEAFAGFVPVAPEIVGQAFKRAVDGVETGQVFRLD